MKEAQERANQTKEAADKFLAEKESIASACAEASAGEIVVSAVSIDGSFAGVWIAPVADLQRQVRAVDDGGWSMTFSPGTGLAEIEARCHRMKQLALAKSMAIQRLMERDS